MASAAPASDDALPRRFGDYLLFDKIGEGGMARIYLARSRTGLGGERLVVVKQILPTISSNEEFSQLLIDEAKLAAQLSHGNIAQVTDLGREDDTLYIAMEYVEGFDLRELLRQCSKTKTPLPVEFSLLAVMETLRGLDFAHRKKSDSGTPLGIVHRDVSPSNVLVSFDGEVKLCDFGIARAMGAGLPLPEETIQGKAGYMSPEAASGEPVDGRSDLFALGIIAWELLAGRRLYKGDGGPSLTKAKEARIPALPERGFHDEQRLHAIIMKALARDVGDRYESARAMLRDLEDYVRDAGLVASPLRFGEWLLEHFGTEIVAKRRTRELAAKAIEQGPLVRIEPTSEPPPAAPGSKAVPEVSGTPPPVSVDSDDEQSQSETRKKPSIAPPSLQAVVAPAESQPSGGFPTWAIVIVVLTAAALTAAFVLKP